MSSAWSAAVVTEQVRGVGVRCLAQRPRSVVQVLADALPVHAGRLLLIDPARRSATTYAEFAELVEGAGEALLALPLQTGDRVAVLVRNGLEAAVAIWACARVGLVHVGIPVDAPPERVRDLLALTGAAVLLVQPDLAAGVGASVDVPVLDAAEVLLGSPRPWRADVGLPDEDATYALIATSGTTGRPKAVRVTGRMTGHAAQAYADALDLGPGDTTAIHLPFAWVSGHVTQLAPAMHRGGSAVTMAHFTAQDLVRVAGEHTVTWLDVVPSIWELLLRCPEFTGAALPALRLAVFGGAPAPAGTLDRVRQRVPGIELVDVYALSETCAPVTLLPDAQARAHPGSVGLPAPYVELRVVGQDGADVPGGEPGEVWVRSAAATPGYWGDSEPSPSSAQGWLRTGDLGRLDAGGYLRVAGRAVDLIIRGGVNIYPGEVERALLSTGLLADAVALGVPSALTGHNVAALVVPAPDAVVDPEVLRRAVASAVGRHAVPRPLLVVAALPRNRNGKVDRIAAAALLES